MKKLYYVSISYNVFHRCGFASSMVVSPSGVERSNLVPFTPEEKPDWYELVKNLPIDSEGWQEYIYKVKKEG